MSARPLSRRTVLRGLGTAVSLPWLESMRPFRVARAAETAAVPPTRLAFFYVPNGVHVPDWKPEQLGSEFTLPWILEPLAPLRDRLTVLSGLTLNQARAHGDGGGDHARSLSAFLTTAHPLKTAGGDIRAGISVDQVAAQHVGRATRLASLELGCEKGLQAGSCDTGYSCAYSSNIAWRTESMPLAKEVDPKAVFERLFAGGAPGESAAAQARRQLYRRSVLDAVLSDATGLRSRVGKQDQRKLDQYLHSIREVERRLDQAVAEGPLEPPANQTAPAGIPNSYREHIRLMCDLLALAFQADVTRVATFVLANEGSNRSYKEINVPDGHHDLSHHGGDEEKQAKIRQINRFHIEQLSYFLEQLRASAEGEANILDHSLLVYGSGIGDGNAHNHDHLPILLAGGGNGTVVGNRHLEYPEETPLGNLYVELLNRMGVSTDQFGDSTGGLPGLAG